MPNRRVTYPPRKKMSVPMVARMLGVADKAVLDWIRSGELRAVNLARTPNGRPRYAIEVADIEAFERSREVIPAEPTPKRVRRRAAADVREFV